MARSAAALAILLSLAALDAAQAQTLYRWTDAQGRVHYTDSPPPTSAKEMRTVTTDAAADQRAADALREQNDAIAKRSAERNKSPDEREKEKKEAERKARCGTLMNVVNAFDRGDPVFRETEKGKQELKGADRDIERLRNSQQFQMECQDLASNANAAAAKARTSADAAQRANNATGANASGSNNSGSAGSSGGGGGAAGTSNANTGASSNATPNPPGSPASNSGRK